MKKIIPLASLVLLQVLRSVAANEPDFKRHTFQLSVATSLDHQFVVRKSKDPVMAQLWKDAERPFVGFCFGAQYIYRPIRMIGISAGFESLEYGSKYGKTEYYDGNGTYTTTAVFKGYSFDGSIGVPIYVHFYRQISRVTIEFATGPEFFFDVYDITKYQVNYYGPMPVSPDNINSTHYYNNSEIKQSASLAWSVQLLANIPICNAFGISVGPEWKFLDLKQLAPGNNVDYAEPRTVPFFLGVKVGFCFGSNFWKKT